MDIGSTLRTARERRNLSLAQIASTTKIPLVHLEAIEANAFEQAPPGIFIRGFLRAYAREVGIDPREIVNQFIAEHALDTPPPIEPSPATDAPPVERVEASDLDPGGSGSIWGSLAVVAVLIVAVVGIQQLDRDDPAPTSQGQTQGPLPGGAEPASAADLSPVATTGRTVPTAATAEQANPAGGRFQIQAEGLCWVEAVVDGQKLVYRLMQPGERASVDPERELVLRVGDPAAVTYFVDGAPGEPLGKRGIPVTVRFTSEGERLTRAS